MGGRTKIMVAGGSTLDEWKNSKPLDIVEILDFQTGSWVEGARLPWPMTGVSLVEEGGNPILIGRYGDERTGRVMMYKEDAYG